MSDGASSSRSVEKTASTHLNALLLIVQLHLSGLLRSRVISTKGKPHKSEREERDIAGYLYHNHNWPLRGAGTEEAIYLNLNGGAGWAGAEGQRRG